MVEKITREHKIKDTRNILENTLYVFKNKKYKKRFIITSLIFLIVYTFLYGIWRIPIFNFGFNRMSGTGVLDYIFVLLISLLSAMFITLNKYEKDMFSNSNLKTGFTGIGVAGTISAICPVCQGIGIAGLGSTLLNIPLSFIIPYLGVLKIISVGLLGLGVFLKADSIFTKTCRTFKTFNLKKIFKTGSLKKQPILFKNNFIFVGVTIITSLLFINQLLIPIAFASVSLGGGTINLGKFEYGSKITLKPMPLAANEQPAIQGYRTRVKPLPTISELPIKTATGDAVQDLLNNVVPSGTPWYGQQAEVSFDDPIAAQNRWATYNSIGLTPSEQERWNRIANSFTCDYCCGSPQNPTIITRCGCAHASAAKGMIKWFIEYHGNSYSDEEIYGEIARWYALWYPKGTVERIIQESQL